MAFAVACKGRQAPFLLNDDLLRRKVAGRVVTVRCRQCHATIEVDASEVDPTALLPIDKPMPPTPKAPTPPAGPVQLKPMAVQTAPAPPRRVKTSTPIGIGSSAPPPAAPAVGAVSPG